MPGHTNTKADLGLLRNKFRKNIDAGEKLLGAEFEMVFDGYPDLTVLIRTAQMPAMGRADVEDFGPMGLNFTQHGPLENKGEITVTCVETIKGPVVRALQDMIRGKKYVNLSIKPTPESLGGTPAKGMTCRMEHCKMRSDAIEFSTEDVQSLVKPSITVTYNWSEWA
jgi:hypothetical protein